MLKATYKNHTIPNTAKATISRNRIYYVDQEMLYFYTIDSPSTVPLFPVKKISHIFVQGSMLCLVSANVLSQYRQTESSITINATVTLAAVPSRVRYSTEGILFLYDDCDPEVYNTRLYKVQACSQILDIAMHGSSCFVLAEGGDIYRSMNILSTHYIQLNRKMRIVGTKTHEAFTSIAVVKDSVVLSSTDGISKYKIHGQLLELEYSLQYAGTVLDGLLCGEDTIELGSAPFLCIRDRLYACADGMGLSASRVYFFEEEEKDCMNELELDYSSLEERTVNANSIEVPEFIKNSAVESRYRNIEAELLKYSMMYDQLCGVDFTARERELRSRCAHFEAEFERLGERAKKARERIKRLEEKAATIVVKGEADVFQERIGCLEKLLGGFEKRGLRELRDRLRAQKHILECKLGRR